MPELPEVETTIRILRKKILGRTFVDFWTDHYRIDKKIKGLKIKEIRRKGKNILIDLSDKKTLLVHQKMTGHLLIGKWKKTKESWVSQVKGPLLEDSMNRFIHLIFFLDNRKMLALSDLRKFAKVELWNTNKLEKAKEIKNLGPEPLNKNFSLIKFKQAIRSKKGKIKEVLMDQNVIAGIGNIYSSEILWQADIHPLRKTNKLADEELKKIYKAMKNILEKSIQLQGESFSDYRTPEGKKGHFDTIRKVYKREGEPCPKCHTIIKRIKVGQRSAYYCPSCQLL